MQLPQLPQLPRSGVGLAALGVAGAVTEVVAVRGGAGVPASAVDLAAGWSLLVAAARVRTQHRWAATWCAATALLWFAGTWSEVGSVPLAVTGTAAAVATGWSVPLVTALLATPDRLPRAALGRVAVAALALRALAPGAAGDARAGVLCGGLVVAAATAQALGHHAFRPLRAAAAAVGAVLLGIAVAALWHRDVPVAEPALAIAVLAAGVALAGTATPSKAAVAERLMIEIGRSRDTSSQQRLLAVGMADPDLRLLHRLGSGPLVDTGGRHAGPPRAGRAITVLHRPDREPVARGSGTDGVTVALDHVAGALDDDVVRACAVTVAGSLAHRLGDAAAAAAQAEALARSRRGLVEAEEQERGELVRRLATGPARDLAGAGDLLEQVEATQLPGDLREALERARELTRQTRQELLETATDGVGRRLRRDGLAAALGHLAAGAGATAQVHPALASTPDDSAGGPVAQVAWFVVAEALTNAVRHSGAARIRVTALSSGTLLTVEVTDDGIGGAAATGTGLTGLRRRVAEVGGHLDVGDGPAGGTVVRAALPWGLDGSAGAVPGFGGVRRPRRA